MPSSSTELAVVVWMNPDPSPQSRLLMTLTSIDTNFPSLFPVSELVSSPLFAGIRVSTLDSLVDDILNATAEHPAIVPYVMARGILGWEHFTEHKGLA